MTIKQQFFASYRLHLGIKISFMTNLVTSTDQNIGNNAMKRNAQSKKVPDQESIPSTFYKRVFLYKIWRQNLQS
jgi:hypothetical protein